MEQAKLTVSNEEIRDKVEQAQNLLISELKKQIPSRGARYGDFEEHKNGMEMEFSVRHLGNWTGDYDFGMIDDKTDKLIDKVIDEVQQKTGCQIDAQCGEKQYMYFTVAYDRELINTLQNPVKNDLHNAFWELSDEQQNMILKLDDLAESQGKKLGFNTDAKSAQKEYQRVLNIAKNMGIYKEPKVSLKYKGNQNKQKINTNER